MELKNIAKDELGLVANTIRVISAEGVDRANSGHPGMPMGVAEIGAALWLGHLNIAPKDPDWVNRDRFVLSNGHGSMFLYTMLHLSGHDVSMEDLKSFRQWGSITPGHPESFMTPGVEATTGPLGQGISNAVGMAVGQKLMAARYNDASNQIIDHMIYCIVGDGCLMEGVSSEASSIAGHLGLGNIVTLYDDNHISIAGSTDLAFTEDVGKRYEAYGWHVLHVDGHDALAIDQAVAEAKTVTDKPSLICARTIIGKGSPNKADSSGVHGSPLGADELALMKKELGWSEEPFTVPEQVKKIFAARAEEWSKSYEDWNSKFGAWKSANSEKASTLELQMKREVPANLRAELLGSIPNPPEKLATRVLSGMVLQAASSVVPSLIGGSADLEPSTMTLIKDSTDVTKDSFAGLNLRFGVREHAMGSIMNGLSYYGSFIPYGSTFLCFADYMRPAIRIAALSHLPGLFIFTHDSVFLGEDGPTHQPIEHINSLRMMPNLHVYRPADGIETALSYELALKRKDGPCAMLFSRQGVVPLERPAAFSEDDVAKGGYTVFESGAEPELVFVASGAEVSLAVEAAKLCKTANVRVVSMCCHELYAEQSQSYRDSLIPRTAKCCIVEAGSTFGWCDMLGVDPAETLCIGIDRFGASAPAGEIAEHFGLTKEKVAQSVSERFSL